MADKKIVSETADFTITKKSTDAKTKDIIIKLPKVGKYDIYQKEFPANLPNGYTWINNFGLKERKKDPKDPNKSLDTTISDPYSVVVDTYIIELDDVSGKEPVYFDGSTVRDFPTKKTNIGNNRIQVTLALGDPPIGWP
jgi:hypothetical protein